jgi:hypothetical protein
MLPYFAAAVVGAIFVQRKRPAVTHVKKTVLGRSGVSYEADDFTSAGMVILKAPDGTIATFARKAPPEFGYVFVQGKGDPRVIALIQKDFVE